MISRRIFIKEGGLTAVGLSMVPGFLQRAVYAAPAGRQKTLVVVFQRGGVDGLNMVVPFGTPAYYEYRPTIAIPAPGKEGDAAAIDLDGSFGLHPALRPLAPLYKKGKLAIVNAVGSPDTGNRSHFQAQDYMESGAPGNKSVSTGWLNRYLTGAPLPDPTPLRATALGESMPKALRGPAPALTLGRLEQLQQGGGSTLFQSEYQKESNALLTGAANEMFNAMALLKTVDPTKYEPARGVNYGGGNAGGLGLALRQISQLIKANVGLQIAFVDVTGWDTHQGETERLTPLLTGLARGLAAFYQDLGDRMEDVVVLTMSEFGRTARENGNGGTDHGHANTMFLLGGRVNGGKLYGKWPGLEKEQLNENRDLALTTDFRDVFAEVLVGHLACREPQAVFPGYAIDTNRFLKMI